MVEDFKKDQIFENLKDFESQDQLRESVLNSALSVEFRSGWATFKENFEPEEFKILL